MSGYTPLTSHFSDGARGQPEKCCDLCGGYEGFHDRAIQQSFRIHTAQSLSQRSHAVDDRKFVKIEQIPVAFGDGGQLAKARKSGGKRKTEGAKKEEAEVPRPQTLEQWVAFHGIADPNRLAELLSSLKVHGERAEDKLHKEFSPWLVKFALVVDKNAICTQAWEELKSSYDVLLLLKDLYLFTYPGKTTSDVLKDACRFLKDELDKLIPKYGTLHKHTSDLFNDPKLRLLGVLNNEITVLFREPMSLITTAQQELNVVRNWAEKMGSYKTEAHDLYLHSMATKIRTATGEYHYSELTTLIEAALAAHGAEEEEAFDQKTLERRVQRYAKRMNLARDRQPPS